jgi:hypothetical protein
MFVFITGICKAKVAVGSSCPSNVACSSSFCDQGKIMLWALTTCDSIPVVCLSALTWFLVQEYAKTKQLLEAVVQIMMAASADHVLQASAIHI